MRILIVDDSEDWRDLIEAELLSAGYDDVRNAESAEQAYRLLGLAGTAASAADLIILDVVMPRIDGIEACARIRSDRRYGDVPIIMVTSLEDMDSLANAFVAGATDYITKPYSRVELLARVRSALRHKAELDRRKARERELISLARLTYGEPDRKRFIDAATGLLCGPAAEAYLSAAAAQELGEAISVFALAIDRLDALRTADGEQARGKILAEVAQAVRGTSAPIGITAAAYHDGIIVLIAPNFDAGAARTLAETLRAAIERLRLANSEAVASDMVTVSVGVVTARSCRETSRASFIADARATAQQAAAAGGNCVVAVDLSSLSSVVLRRVLA